MAAVILAAYREAGAGTVSGRRKAQVVLSPTTQVGYSR
jgi:hypothetical protein